MHPTAEKRKKKIIKKFGKKHKLTMDMCLRKMKKIDPVTGKKKRKFCRQTNNISNITGYCKYHETKANKIVKGKYSRFWGNKELCEIYNSFLNDPDLFNLRDEIALLRTILVEVRECSDGKMRTHIYKENTLIKLIREIGTLVERLHKIENNHFSVEAIPIVINQIILALNDTMRSCDKCGTSLSKQTNQVYEKLETIGMPNKEWLNGAKKDREASINRLRRKKYQEN